MNVSPVVWRSVCDTAPARRHCVQVAISATNMTLGAEADLRRRRWAGRTRLRRIYDQALKGKCTANKTVVEVGAGLGVHSLYFASRSCTVLALEPEDSQRRLLEVSRTRLRQPDLLTIDSRAITSSTRDDAILRVAPRSPGLSHLSSLANPYKDRFYWSRATVPAIQLDRLLNYDEAKFVDLMIVDVQGGEYAVLCSTRGLMMSGVVRDLLVHVDPSITTITQARWLRTQIESSGFRMVPVHDATYQWRWQEFTTRRGAGVVHYRFDRPAAVRSCAGTCSCTPPPVHARPAKFARTLAVK
jgi:FkbM family methyltransferase